jgi:biopolymer transport protein ExbD
MPLGKRQESKIPTIDLVPMLTVMMGVLAFFVVIAVSLGSEQLIEVELPPEQTRIFHRTSYPLPMKFSLWRWMRNRKCLSMVSRLIVRSWR